MWHASWYYQPKEVDGSGSSRASWLLSIIRGRAGAHIHVVTLQLQGRDCARRYRIHARAQLVLRVIIDEIWRART